VRGKCFVRSSFLSCTAVLPSLDTAFLTFRGYLGRFRTYHIFTMIRSLSTPPRPPRIGRCPFDRSDQKQETPPKDAFLNEPFERVCLSPLLLIQSAPAAMSTFSLRRDHTFQTALAVFFPLLASFFPRPPPFVKGGAISKTQAAEHDYLSCASISSLFPCRFLYSVAVDMEHHDLRRVSESFSAPKPKGQKYSRLSFLDCHGPPSSASLSGHTPLLSAEW